MQIFKKENTSFNPQSKRIKGKKIKTNCNRDTARSDYATVACNTSIFSIFDQLKIRMKTDNQVDGDAPLQTKNLIVVSIEIFDIEQSSPFSLKHLESC